MELYLKNNSERMTELTIFYLDKLSFKYQDIEKLLNKQVSSLFCTYVPFLNNILYELHPLRDEGGNLSKTTNDEHSIINYRCKTTGWNLTGRTTCYILYI